ncbi:MAG: FTR1 family protein [Anaerolineales bacterium]|nr:FTR1 family protein [Anaerolineales bacterium]
MLASLLLTLREGLEAALLVGITLGALRRLHQADQRRWVWFGVAAAVLLSLAAAAGLQAVGAKLEGRAEQVFEGVTMLVAAGVLTWMILWLQRQGRQTQTSLEAEVQSAALHKQSWAIFLIAFTAVVREGVETALFLSAAAMTTSSKEVLAGAVLGLAAAGVLGYVLYASTRRLNLHRFFQVTGVLLMLFAAGLVGHSVHEFNEAGVIPAVIAPVWDINHIFDEDSSLGQISKALFGYNGNPSLSEALAYLAYFMVVVSASVRQGRPVAQPRPSVEA